MKEEKFDAIAVKELIEWSSRLADKADAVGDCDHKRCSCEEIGCIGHEIRRVREALAKLKI